MWHVRIMRQLTKCRILLFVPSAPTTSLNPDAVVPSVNVSTICPSSFRWELATGFDQMILCFGIPVRRTFRSCHRSISGASRPSPKARSLFHVAFIDLRNHDELLLKLPVLASCTSIHSQIAILGTSRLLHSWLFPSPFSLQAYWGFHE